MPKVFFIGDIVGRPGRNIVKEKLPQLREEHGFDFVVANAENAAGGNGLTAALAHELSSYGVDAMTLGDHVWDQKNFENEIDALETVCRPANLPSICPGRTHVVIENNGFKLGILTVLGRNFMKIQAECPFKTTDHVLSILEDEVDAVLVEVHAEATSEKVAMGWYLNGLVSCVVGTHTHTPTADACILNEGTAYLTDAGMTGPYQSVLGREIDSIIATFLDGVPRNRPIAQEDPRLCGLIVNIDENTGLASGVEQVCVRG